MILRSYQKRLVEKAERALKDHGNTLACAATGAGKTIMLAALAKKMRGKSGKALVLQHRDEILTQNLKKFLKVNPGERVSIYNADTKSFHGDSTFAMQQTLARNLDAIPHLDLLIVDEAHHLAAPTYASIIEAAKDKNPNLMLAGFTATPERADNGLNSTL